MGRKKKKEIFVDLNIESIGFEGVAIGRDDDIVHFVKYAVPGDKLKAQVFKKKKSFRHCRIVEMYEESEHRETPVCKYFGQCGGCSWQNIKYDEQLKWKKQHVKDALERIGKIEYGELADTLPAKQIFNYRNKMDFSFGASRWLTAEEVKDDGDIEQKDFALGLHVPGRFDKVIDIDVCHIQSEFGNEILDSLRKKALEFGVKAYNLRSHEGFLRELIIRRGIKYNQFMIILVTNNPNGKKETDFLKWYETEFLANEKINSGYHSINSTKSPVNIDKLNHLKGNEYITEAILDIDYKISPYSFFQTNPFQLDEFISNILDYADIKSDEIIWDLYCGTGSITLPASKKAKKVIGIELVESSIKDAKENARINDIENVEFHCSDLHEKGIPDLLEKLETPDTVILDPPRAGIHKNLLNHILELAPKKVVYVSCNPSTQARDCQILDEKYKLVKIMPVDMFPQTYHIESIALLELK